MAESKSNKKDEKRTLKIQYETFHRFWDGLLVVCIMVTIIGSLVAGVGTYSVEALTNGAITITWRCVIVYAILGTVGRIIIKSWASLEEMKRGENQASRR